MDNIEKLAAQTKTNKHRRKHRRKQTKPKHNTIFVGQEYAQYTQT